MPDQVNTDTVNQDQNQSLGWRAALPDEWKEHDFVKPYQKPGDFVKSAYEIAQDRDGLKTRLEGSIPKLTEKSTDEEKAAYFKAIGRPEKADGYEIKVPDGLPFDENFVKGFKETAHKAGIPKAQAEQLAGWYFDSMKVNLAAIDKHIETQKTEATNKLKSLWSGQYQENFDLAKKTAQKIGGEEVMKHLDETGVGNDPVMIQFFYKLGTMLSESAFVRSGDPPPKENTTPGGQPMLRFPSMEKK